MAVAEEDYVDRRQVVEGDARGAVEPTRKGFGSRIIGMGLTGSGGVKRHYDTTGLSVEASVPLYQVQEA